MTTEQWEPVNDVTLYCDCPEKCGTALHYVKDFSIELEDIVGIINFCLPEGYALCKRVEPDDE
jgi:hypothetical protein